MDTQFDEIQGEVYRQLVTTKNIPAIEQLLVRYHDLLAVDRHKQNPNYPLHHECYNRMRAQVRQVRLRAHDEHSAEAQRHRLEKYRVTPPSTDDPREALFAGRSAASTKAEAEELAKKQVASTNKKITLGLQLIRQMMTLSILQTELNIDNIDQQTKDLTQLNENYLKFSGILEVSGQVVKFIKKQDRSDQRRIRYALIFLGLVVFRVFWRRALSWPIRMALWWFFRLFRVFTWMFGGSKGAKEVVGDMSQAASEALAEATPSVDFVTEALMSTVVAASVIALSMMVLSHIEEVEEDPATIEVAWPLDEAQKHEENQPIGEPSEVREEEMVHEAPEEAQATPAVEEASDDAQAADGEYNYAEEELAEPVDEPEATQDVQADEAEYKSHEAPEQQHAPEEHHGVPEEHNEAPDEPHESLEEHHQATEAHHDAPEMHIDHQVQEAENDAEGIREAQGAVSSINEENSYNDVHEPAPEQIPEPSVEHEAPPVDPPHAEPEEEPVVDQEALHEAVESLEQQQEHGEAQQTAHEQPQDAPHDEL